MGCDIHLFLEIQDKDGKWVPAQATFDNEKDENGTVRPYIPYRDRLYKDRDYTVFGWLAGVREPDKQRFEPRGLPNDIHPTTKALLSDEHTQSWLGVDEVLAALDETEDKRLTCTISGMMDGKDLVRFKKVLAKAKAEGETLDFWALMKRARVNAMCGLTTDKSYRRFSAKVHLAPELKRFREAMVRAADYRYWDPRAGYPDSSREWDEKHRHYSGKGARIVFDFDS